MFSSVEVKKEMACWSSKSTALVTIAGLTPLPDVRYDSTAHVFTAMEIE
jgi:hypothetical protein